jgi:hypothetical protein
MGFVSLDQLKQWCQITNNAEDEVLEILLESVQQDMAKELGMYFHEGDGALVEYVDAAPRGMYLRPDHLPINSITKISDTTNSDDVVDTEYYKFTAWKIIYVGSGVVEIPWPPGVQRWKVEYDAGYGPTTAPNWLKLLILDVAYRIYHGRGAKESQRGAGYSYDWPALMKADIGRRIRQHGTKLGIS